MNNPLRRTWMLALVLLFVSAVPSFAYSVSVQDNLSSPGQFVFNVTCSDAESRNDLGFNKKITYGAAVCYIQPGVTFYHLNVTGSSSGGTAELSDDEGFIDNIPVQHEAPSAPCSAGQVGKYGEPGPCAYQSASQGLNASLAPMLKPLLPIFVVMFAIWLSPFVLRHFLNKSPAWADYKARQERVAVKEKMLKRAERKAVRVKEANAHNEVMRRIDDKGDKASLAEKYYHRLHKDDWAKTKQRLETGERPSRTAVKSGISREQRWADSSPVGEPEDYPSKPGWWRDSKDGGLVST